MVYFDNTQFRDDPKCTANTEYQLHQTETDDDEVVICLTRSRIFKLNVLEADLPAQFVCNCEICPAVPEQHSLCCQADSKIVSVCTESAVTCITKSEMLSRLWDKVNCFTVTTISTALK